MDNAIAMMMIQSTLSDPESRAGVEATVSGFLTDIGIGAITLHPVDASAGIEHGPVGEIVAVIMQAVCDRLGVENMTDPNEVMQA